MVRSMYSGVSGMKAHQARMDVIGNNIANVNTYGFKGSRATFRDIYYQTLKGAAGASSTGGGTNPSAVGYGAQLSSVDVLQTRSTFQMTDNPMDAAIDGDGFLQVQDADGNIFYTRAGMMTFDSSGNLVDSQGNFVLGVQGDPLFKEPASERIQVSVPPVPPKGAQGNISVNNVGITITATNPTVDSNVSFTFLTGDATMNIADEATAEVGTNGIVITLNPNTIFTSQEHLSQAVNAAIKKASNDKTGKDHPAGDFSITLDPADKFGANGLTGKEICGTNYGKNYGSVAGWTTGLKGIKPTGKSGAEFGKGFTTVPPAKPGFTDFVITPTPNAGVPTSFLVTATIGGIAYSNTITDTTQFLQKGVFSLKALGTSDTDTIEVEFPSFADMTNQVKIVAAGADGILGNADDVTTYPAYNHRNILNAGPPAGTAGDAFFTGKTATKTTDSKSLGFMSNKILLKGGTEGGEQGIENLSGISIGPDGMVTAIHPIHGNIPVGRIDLVTFANPQGLTQAGGTYFTASANSGNLSVSHPGTQGSGQLVSGSLESSNVDLSREFSDMIVTQRGFQANSRLITVSDEMLNELVNLKR